MNVYTSGKEIIQDNLSQWETALRLFEKTTGLTTSLYVTPSKRVLGPFSTSPLGKHLIEAGAFRENHIAHRAEVDELIPLIALKKIRHKKFADALGILCVPIMVDNELIGSVYAGWVFDHFADPIECDRLGRLLGISGFDLLQIARIQAPVSQEKLKIFEEMLSLIITTLTDQLVAINDLKEASMVKDELLSLVSHELKTPLTALLLRVQMLRAKKVPEEKVPTFLANIEEDALVQSQLIEELIDAAKIMIGKLTIDLSTIDLKSVILESIDMVESFARSRNISIEFKDFGSDYRFEGDHHRLTQCFWSILVNSVKIIPPNGKIRVYLTRSYTGFQIRIEDSENGFDQQTLPSIFDRFTKTDTNESTSGLGLGMHIVKKIIELHAGKIEIHTEINKSKSSLEIFLPLSGLTLSDEML